MGRVFYSDILNNYIELIYGFEVKDPYVINQITRVIGYLKDNDYTDDEIMHYLLHNGPVIGEALFNTLTKCVLYHNSELVIEPTAPIWHPEKGYEAVKYYREPRCRFTMDDLLDMFYTKIKVPYELQDRKRDSGAFRHLLEKYNFKYFTSLDFVITMIKLAEEYGVCSTNVFEIEKYADKALEMLTESVENNKLSIIWRDK